MALVANKNDKFGSSAPCQRNLTDEAKWSLVSVRRMIESGSIQASDVAKEFEDLAKIIKKKVNPWTK